MPVEQDTTVTLTFVLGLPPTVTINKQKLSVFSPEESMLRRQERPRLPSVDPETAVDIRRLIAVTGMRNAATTFFGAHLLGIRAQLFKDLPANVDHEKVANQFQRHCDRGQLENRPRTCPSSSCLDRATVRDLHP